MPLIAHVQVLPHPPPASVNLEGWTQARGDLHEGLWPSQPEMRLWYKTRDQFVDGLRRAVDDADIITELSVHYGDEDPFFGYHRIEGGKVNPGKDGRWDSVDIVYRRGNPIPPSAPLPRFHVTGDYKVMQSESKQITSTLTILSRRPSLLRRPGQVQGHGQGTLHG